MRSRPWIRRIGIGVPLLVLVLLTAGLAVTPLPARQPGPVPDVRIPITFRESDGRARLCWFDIRLELAPTGDPRRAPDAPERMRALAELLRHHNWTGLGQRSYDTAVARVRDDAARGLEAEFSAALGERISRNLPGVHLFVAGGFYGNASTDCDFDAPPATPDAS